MNINNSKKVAILFIKFLLIILSLYLTFLVLKYLKTSIQEKNPSFSKTMKITLPYGYEPDENGEIKNFSHLKNLNFEVFITEQNKTIRAKKLYSFFPKKFSSKKLNNENINFNSLTLELYCIASNNITLYSTIDLSPNEKNLIWGNYCWTSYEFSQIANTVTFFMGFKPNINFLIFELATFFIILFIFYCLFITFEPSNKKIIHRMTTFKLPELYKELKDKGIIDSKIPDLNETDVETLVSQIFVVDDDNKENSDLFKNEYTNKKKKKK